MEGHGTTQVHFELKLPVPPLKKPSSIRITLPPSAIPPHFQAAAGPVQMTFNSSIGELRGCDSHIMSPRAPSSPFNGDSGPPDAKTVAVVTSGATPSSILLSPRMDEEGEDGHEDLLGNYVSSARQPIHAEGGQLPYGDENAKPVGTYLETMDSGRSTEPSPLSSGMGSDLAEPNRMVDVSHTLPPGTTIRSILTNELSDELAGRLITGCTVRKHNATGEGVIRRKIYVNFEDGTLRVEHLIPLVQSFMKEQKGTYYLYKCYRACPWDKSVKGKERMIRNKGYVNPNMRDRTISLVTRGGGESLVATFDTVEEFKLWLEGLRFLQNQTGKYFSYFFKELEHTQCKSSIRKAARWSTLVARSSKTKST